MLDLPLYRNCSFFDDMLGLFLSLYQVYIVSQLCILHYCRLSAEAYSILNWLTLFIYHQLCWAPDLKCRLQLGNLRFSELGDFPSNRSYLIIGQGIIFAIAAHMLTLFKKGFWNRFIQKYRFFFVQDQFDSVSTYTQKGIDFCEKFSHFLKERSSIENEYAAKLK